MRGYWARARRGRGLHFFVRVAGTACGEERWGARPSDDGKKCGLCVRAIEKEEAKKLEVVG